jgi:[ribosomal protein S18]-alanine N-acetyltransferase
LIAVFRSWALRFRPMEQADIPGVLAIETVAYAYPWNEGTYQDCFRAGYSMWVMEYRREICGYGILSMGAGEAHLLNVCVDPSQQGKGFGREILAHMIELGRSLGNDMMFLEVRPTNIAAVRLYESVGFSEVGVRKGYYPAPGGREDAVVLALQLTPYLNMNR